MCDGNCRHAKKWETKSKNGWAAFFELQESVFENEWRRLRRLSTTEPREAVPSAASVGLTSEYALKKVYELQKAEWEENGCKEECPMCLEGFDPSMMYDPEMGAYMLPCMHFIHAGRCLSAYVQSKARDCGDMTEPPSTQPGRVQPLPCPYRCETKCTSEYDKVNCTTRTKLLNNSFAKRERDANADELKTLIEDGMLAIVVEGTTAYMVNGANAGKKNYTWLKKGLFKQCGLGWNGELKRWEGNTSGPISKYLCG